MAGKNVVAEAALLERGHLRRTRKSPARRSIQTERPAPPVPPEDESDLLWYFSEETRTTRDGGACSNFNAMLERMSLYAKESHPCVSCGGVREVAVEVTDDSGQVTGREVVVKAKPGTGFVTSSREFIEWKRIARLCKRPSDAKAALAWVDRQQQKRVSRESVEFGEMGEVYKVSKTDLIPDTTCPNCKGWGCTFSWLKDHHREITVDFTGKQPQTVASVSLGNDEAIKRYAQVGRKRAAVREADPVAEAALEMYYSPSGQSEACLWSLTDTGQKLLRERRGNMTDEQFFHVLQLAQEKDSSAKRRAELDAEARHASLAFLDVRKRDRRREFEQANAEARLLLQRVRAVWFQVVTSR